MMIVMRRVQEGKEREESESWGWKDGGLSNEDMHMNKKGLKMTEFLLLLPL